MIVIIEQGIEQGRLDHIAQIIREAGFQYYMNPGIDQTIIAVPGNLDEEKEHLIYLLENTSGVEKIELISEPFKLSSRKYHPENLVFNVGQVPIGSSKIVVIAGPCSVENRSQTIETAVAIKEAGADILRGGVFKPRSSPHSFQGLGQAGLEILEEARSVTGMPIITEVLDINDVEMLSQRVDIIQIGARNMQNFSLLNKVGETKIPVMLKRGAGARLEEFLMAAEYIIARGNDKVILCERGITTFEVMSRYTTDINAIPLLKQKSYLPVFLDPSHATGDWPLVGPIAKAGLVAGADGLIVEVHNNPSEAMSDGKQSLKPYRFAQLMAEIQRLKKFLERD